MLSNKKLNDLRDEVTQEPKIGFDITMLLEKTKRIHVGWLFDLKYLPLLQKICRFMDGNFDTALTPGWKSFGHHLGVSSEIIRVIDCSKLGHEGYTYYVLQHYAEKDDSTLHGVIRALLNIERFDTLQETHSLVNSLADDILSLNDDQQGQVDSGYYSEPNNRDTPEEGEQENQRLLTLIEHIIKPVSIPTPALVLRELKEQIQTATRLPQPPKQEDVMLVTSATVRKPSIVEPPEQQHRKKVQKYDCTVLLTFAGDGIESACEIAKNLRGKREDNRTIGVIILNDHETVVGSNPEDFIYSVFSQVDYVIPIITNDYLQGTVDISSPGLQDYHYIDCKYVRFIFTLMRKYYVQNGCLNKKIRCIIPDNLIHLTHKRLMRDPIFETWVKSSSVDKLAERMLRRCVRKGNSEPQIIEA